MKESTRKDTLGEFWHGTSIILKQRAGEHLAGNSKKKQKHDSPLSLHMKQTRGRGDDMQPTRLQHGRSKIPETSQQNLMEKRIRDLENKVDGKSEELQNTIMLLNAEKEECAKLRKRSQDLKGARENLAAELGQVIQELTEAINKVSIKLGNEMEERSRLAVQAQQQPRELAMSIARVKKLEPEMEALQAVLQMNGISGQYLQDCVAMHECSYAEDQTNGVTDLDVE